jgi:hypothetical protein
LFTATAADRRKIPLKTERLDFKCKKSDLK